MKITEYSFKWRHREKRMWRSNSGKAPHAGPGKIWRHGRDGWYKKSLSDVMSIGIQSIKDKEVNVRQATEEEEQYWNEIAEREKDRHSKPW